MAKYGDIAIRAVKYVKEFNFNPIDAWMKASYEIFPNSESSRAKACPKNTFLGLCEEDVVRFVSQSEYTKSKKNKEYALKAVHLLKEHPELAEDQMKLWKIIVGDEKAHNYQMDVVVNLFRMNYLK